jgi:c-di-GMP-related signal transduction protein
MCRTNVTRILLNMRRSDVLAEIPVGAEIKRALLGFPSRYRSIFEVVLDYESGTWEQLEFAESDRDESELIARFVPSIGGMGDRGSRV